MIREFVAYFCAVFTALLVDFGLYALLIVFLNVNYLAANIAGFSAGMLLSYYLCITYVFKYRQYTRTRTELPVFFLIGLVNCGIGELLLLFLVARVGVNVFFAKVIMAGVIFCLNYFFRKRLLFTGSHA
jgi:putative flippase GtrA